MFEPLGDNILVLPDPKQESVGSFVLPEKEKEKVQKGVAVAVGPGKKLASGEFVETTVKEGDYIAFGKYNYTTINLDGVEHFIINESKISGIIKRKQ